MDEIFKNLLEIEEIKNIEFKKITAGEWIFYFVFSKQESIIQDCLTSAEIIPLGIIYKSNKEYYFAPLSENYDLSEIIKNFAKII